MQLPKRDEWVRLGYTIIGGSTAILWNKYLPLSAKGGGYVPPAALATLILISNESRATEKDIAAGILGYTCAAQAISLSTRDKGDESATVGDVSLAQRQNEMSQNPTIEDQASKLEKIRAVTGTLGAIADIVGKFRG
jgi:hypothetical protein